VAHALDPGSKAKLMFLTAAGMVLGSAEMLTPIAFSLQPFRFLALHRDDQGRLETTIQQCIEQSRADHGRIEPSRAW